MASKSTKVGTLSVTGEGRATSKPDVARLSLSVIVEAKTAGDALREVGARATNVVHALVAAGVTPKGIQTRSADLSPLYQAPDASSPAVIVGYRAETTVAVETGVDLAGAALDAGVSAGANQSYGLSFGVKDETSLRAKALKAAAKAAKADAEIAASALGVELLHPKLIEVQDQGRPIFFAKASRETAGTPIEPGEVAVVARVRVEFETA